MIVHIHKKATPLLYHKSGKAALIRTAMPRKLVVLLSFFSFAHTCAAQELSGAVADGRVLLQWTGFDSLLIDHFEVEKKQPDGSYRVVALILPDPSVQLFTYRDKITSSNGKLAYRVRGVAPDGTAYMTNAARLTADEVNQQLIRMVKDEAKQQMILQLPVVSGSYVCRVYNTAGQLLLTQKASAAAPAVSVADLISGTYFMEAFHPQSGKRYYATFKH